jgi:hypothetical protein
MDQSLTTPEPETPLTPYIVTGLARETALGLREEADILATFKVSTDTYEKLKQDELFQKLVDAARIEWQSALNTVARTQLEAAAAVEAAMPHIYARMIDPKEPLNHAVEAGKWLADMAGLKKVQGSSEPGERFKIEINLGADTRLSFEKTIDMMPGDPMLQAIEQAERV